MPEAECYPWHPEHCRQGSVLPWAAVPRITSWVQHSQLGTTQPVGYNTIQPGTTQPMEYNTIQLGTTQHNPAQPEPQSFLISDFQGPENDFPPTLLGRQMPTLFPRLGMGPQPCCCTKQHGTGCHPGCICHCINSTKPLPLWRSTVSIGRSPRVAAHCSEQPHAGNKPAQGYQ